jgi:glutaminase
MACKKGTVLTFLASGLFFAYTACWAGQTISPEQMTRDLKQVYKMYKNLDEGKNADYIPELAKVNPQLFAIVVATADGKIYAIGDAGTPFAIESISKPFVYALALEDNGEDSVTQKIGLNQTGLPFNSVLAIEQQPNHLGNPLVNAGALQTTSLIKGKNSEEKWRRILTLFQALSDGNPYLGEAVYHSETATNIHNRAIAQLLLSYNMMYDDPTQVLDLYTKDCSIMVTTRELAMMGATLANGGRNPFTHQNVLTPQSVQDALSEMVVTGLYENSGAWWWQVGLPAKSGVGGGIIAVVPHQMAIAVFSPPLDSAGNSVRAQKVIAALSKKWELHLLTVQSNE